MRATPHNHDTNSSAPQAAHDCLEVRIAHTYPGFALDVHLQLPGRGVSALFGPSGCGKTTCLRCVAGLEQAAQARICINGELWQDSAQRLFVPPHKRSIGYVFQEASLFSHLSVKRNLQYGLRRVAEAAHKVQWDQVMDLLGIAHLLSRMPDKLSGGERQRVSMARALLTSPRLLLMDEPLAALDLQRKREILPYLERLHDELDIPILYVSHAPDEVSRIADHVVLLEQGKAIAQGSVQDTMARTDLPISFREDAGVVIEATLVAHDDKYHLSCLEFSGGSVLVSRRHEEVGHKLRFRVLASDVSLALTRLEGSSINNIWPATVEQISPTDSPAHMLVRLNAQDTPLLARITRRSIDQLHIAPGQRLWAQVKSVALLS